MRRRSLALVGVLALMAGLSSLVGPASADPEPPSPFGHFDPASVPPLSALSELTPQAATPGTSFAGFNSITPERLLDTRTGVGVGGAGTIGPGQSFNVQLAGRGSVPGDATAVIMNVTADAPSEGGFITVYPAGEARPDTSNINVVPGKTVPNLVVMRLNGGSASFYNAFGSVHLIADVTAYARADGHYVGLSPSRILDTRTGNGAPAAKVGPGGVIDVPVLNRGGVPASDVGAVVLNVTVDQPTETSFVTTWPTGSPMPNASSLNMIANQTVANLVIATVGPDGRVSFFNERGTTNLLADVVGYIPSGAAYMPISPVRLVDTRTGQGQSQAFRLGPGQEMVFSVDALYPAFESLNDFFPDSTSVAAYVFNVTAAGPTDTSFLTVYPGGVSRPNASNLNTVAGTNVPNAVVVRPGPNGQVRIYNERGLTDVIVDLVGLVPLQNSLDAVDGLGGSRFHVVYLLGHDSTPTPGIEASIRSDLGFMDDWFLSQTGTRLDFSRTSGQIDISTVRLQNFSEAQNINWINTGLPIYQLMQDGFGFAYNHRYLVYIEGFRPDTLCGVASGQFTTVFTENACSDVGDVPSAASIGDGSDNSGFVTLHEMLHGLGAVAPCATNYTPTGGGHVTSGNDLMFHTANGVPKTIDVDHNDYFGHSIPGCIDLQDSPYMTNVAG